MSVGCIDGNTVSIYENTTLIGSGTCVAETTFITPVQPLTNGVHQFFAKQGSPASNASDTLSITIDTSAPTAPSTLIYSGITQTGVNLSWNDSTDTSGVAGYIIYRNGVQASVQNQISFTDSGLTANTTYLYTVKAKDTAGNISDNSNTASVQTTGASGGG